jgi:hypothetical protein
MHVPLIVLALMAVCMLHCRAAGVNKCAQYFPAQVGATSLPGFKLQVRLRVEAVQPQQHCYIAYARAADKMLAAVPGNKAIGDQQQPS